MRSEVVNMKQRQEKSLISSSSEPVPTFQSTTSSKNLEPLILNTKHPIYEGCDVNKTCFGLPDSCDDPADCDLMATWRLINDEVTKLELYSSLGGRGSYVALGLSRDRRMGEDLVVACLSHKERVSA